MATARCSRHSVPRVTPFRLAALLSFVTAFGSAQEQAQPNVCYRWSGQMAIANAKGSSSEASTLYYFGGEARTSTGQDTNTWTNALVSLPLDQDWQSGTPPLTLVQADSGNYSSPPAVTLGALWASADGNTLYQYGGSFSDSPSVDPPVNHIWSYDIQGGSWNQVETNGDNFGNVAEGQPTIVPGQGENGENVGYYSHGHQDDHTTNSWSNQISRIYLNSMLQFDLGSKKVTNITSYSQDAHTSNSSTPLTNPLSRADGTLTYVPGLGTNGKGVLVSIGGATTDQYVDNSVLDVYDLGTQGWTRQSTLGDTMPRKVNQCATRGTAKVDGVQVHHIFVYGGQKLNQSERDSEMYILTIKENDYTWSFVGGDLSGQPTGRAGHQCAMMGNQFVVVGGLTRDDVLCDQPGISVYNTSSSSWQNQYKANTVFSTPELVANITGGIGTGSSTSGAGSATGGDGADDPDTSGSNGSGSGFDGGGGGGGGTNVGAIVGGVVGGVLGLALIALIVFLLMRRKRKQREEERALAEKSQLTGRSDSGSSHNGLASFVFPQGKHSQQDSHGSSFPPGSLWDRRQSGVGSAGGGPADDDVEHVAEGMDTAFVTTGFVPKAQLRVVNADNDD
ncbi:hypothetical protein JCM10207_001514 [Rhodosporidiobolus poonsookiae]